MTFMLFQAFLLMAAAYFLGAFLGCWWRRTFHRPVEVEAGRDALAASGTVAMAPGDTAVRVPAAEPIPVQPRIQYVAPPEGVSDATRFGRALSGTGSLSEAREVAASADAASPAIAESMPPPVVEAAPKPEHLAPAARQTEIVSAPAPLPPAEPAPVAVAAAPAVPAPDPRAARETDDAVAAAAAAAAAAMAIAARHRAARQSAGEAHDVVEAKVAVTPGELPVAVSSAGVSGVAAQVRTPPLVPADRQDLKLIRGVDEMTERTLNGLGIWRYRDIAHWRRSDVDAANRALDARARVERENWIEQAMLMAGGGLTDFARRRLRGELASSRATALATPSRAPVEAAPQSAAAPRVATPAAASTPAAAAASAAAAIAAAAAAASRGLGSVHRTARPTPPVAKPAAARAAATVPPVVAAPMTPPAIVTPDTPPPSAAIVAPPPAAVAVPPPPPPPAPPAAVAPPPPPAPAPVPTAATPPPGPADLLQRIRGIDGETERALSAAGVRNYRQIAQWGSADVERVDTLLGAPGRISRENWIEQAVILAGGGSTLYSRRRDQMGPLAAATSAAAAAAAATVAASEPHGLRPSRLAEAIRDNQQRGARQPVRSDVAGLRSVRSEALRPQDKGDGGRGFAAGPAEIDDLKRIRGIGVLIEKRLNALGITSYVQIANWTADEIATVSEALDFRGRIERENWVEQARILSAGGQTDFSRRLDRGDVS